MLVNYMELVVEKVLPKILNNYPDICKCQQCLLDIKAYALNNLKPLYYVSQKGEMFYRLNDFEMQFHADVTRVIMKAIDLVSQNPRHCNDKED